MPPGTFLLVREDEASRDHGGRTIILDPVPSDDPNEPLNWSTTRKAVNFTLVLVVSCLIFTALSIQPIFWQLMVVDLNVTYTQLNNAASVNFVGLSTGCVLFIPLAIKYGRRPVYLVSTALMLATSMWLGQIKSLSELYAANLLQGLAGATNESIVQITIADLFFVHHRGGMNGLYMTMVMIGSFLTPMAAGAQATNQGWRWSYYTMSIFTGVIFLLFVLFYEETKYSRVIDGIPAPNDTIYDAQLSNSPHPESAKFDKTGRDPQVVDTATVPIRQSSRDHEVDQSIPIKPWRTRLALITPTSEPIWSYFYRPFLILLRFPTVLFTGLQYASGIVWLTIMSSVLALVFPLPPYNFSPAQVGYMSSGPFIGNLLGAIYGGFLGDWSILFFSRRNKGYFEPEMRLYILHIPAVFLCGGIIMFGVTISRGMHWILPVIAGGFFGFGLGSIGDACLTLVIDSYHDVVGDAFTGIAFLRNAITIGIPFAITPWMETNGLQNMFITCGFISLGITSLCIPMVIFGKRSRRKLAPYYREMASKQG
ncbi:putative MFS transporter [Talaromyces proteolyticus]|uniref:MFS transporter n=1 Tax=Talaromyces proteolyticus TaxID=1131652 RepID=A0AAD4PZ80_9EURO|nr:putative MFS transporter [Talaromyces proteolyticus]KAH8698741.1 putative MFS transporter [Talaromyces proteolyticus]